MQRFQILLVPWPVHLYQQHLHNFIGYTLNSKLNAESQEEFCNEMCDCVIHLLYQFADSPEKENINSVLLK